MLRALPHLVAWSVVVIAARPTLLGHRLDEYLQATRIAVSTAQVVIEVDLTPGSAIAESVVTAIDRDRDDRTTAAEASDYGNAVLRSTHLEVDGHPLALSLIRAQAPDAVALRSGMGTIRLEFGAPWTGATGAHQLLYRNAHREDISVYLVNALAPATPRIRITVQERDVNQRELRLGYEVAATSPQWPPWWALLLGATVVSSALWRSRRRRRLRGERSRPSQSRGD